MDKQLWEVLDNSPPGVDRALPFEVLRAIRIEIEAPRRDDPGELLQSWNKNVLLVEYLSGGASLPFLEICAVENDARQWATTEGILQQSVASPDGYKEGVDSDLELLLMPFRRLRKARGVQIRIPEQPRQEAVKMMVEETEARAVSEKPFGTYLDETDDMDDQMVGSYEFTQRLWFDYMLDDMEGPCAAMVRLARFSTWTERYEKEMYYRTTDGGGGGSVGSAECMLSERQLTDARSALLERYRAMRAWNPDALHHHAGCCRCYCSRGGGDCGGCVGEVITSDHWLKEMWWVSESCKQGVPPRNSQAYQDIVRRHHYAWTRPLVHGATRREIPGLLAYQELRRGVYVL